MADTPMSRRDVLRHSRDVGGLAALSALLSGQSVEGHADAAAATPVPDVYRTIGVRPFINARGTYTVLSGSLMLPEVRAALEAAAQQYVHLDELTEAVGARLATMTGAEWGLVTSGCAAALTHATAACVAGGNPDLHIRIPHLDGFAKDEVVIPTHSRNVYDAAVRAVGVRVIEAATPAEFEAALGPRTAMIYLLAGPKADESALSLKAIAPLAQVRGVPILVDAAAEILTVPNVHLQQGAALVGYSGGKCLRGPQTAGLLLGRKDLVKAAWVHSAPHHGFARGMKVGKEEAIAMLAAVEQWTRRDHDAEWRRWTGWLDLIAARVKAIDGVGLTTEVTQPQGLSNRAPTLRILWDHDRLGRTGESVAQALFHPDAQPRISLFPARGESDARTGVAIMPYMMMPGDAEAIADRLVALLSVRTPSAQAAPAAPAADLSGTWAVTIAYAATTSTHHLHLRQQGAAIDGTHQGEFVSRPIAGRIDGRDVVLRSAYGEEHGDALSFRFQGTLAGDTMSGALDMGEYLSATWTASRRERSSRTP
jgi:L-seryl-tRNA(Ser) seleniumtransferase